VLLFLGISYIYVFGFLNNNNKADEGSDTNMQTVKPMFAFEV
jgi:hypothetical protein